MEIIYRYFLVAQTVKNLLCISETPGSSWVREDPLKGMASYSRFLHETIRPEEPGWPSSSWGHKESETTEGLTLSMFNVYIV